MNDRESQCKEVVANLVRRRKGIIRKALACAEKLAMAEPGDDSGGEDDAVEEDETAADCDDEEEAHAPVNDVAETAGW